MSDDHSGQNPQALSNPILEKAVQDAKSAIDDCEQRITCVNTRLHTLRDQRDVYFLRSDHNDLKKLKQTEYDDYNQRFDNYRANNGEELGRLLNAPVQHRPHSQPLVDNAMNEASRELFFATPKLQSLIQRARDYGLVEHVGHRHPGDISTMECWLSPRSVEHDSVVGCERIVNRLLASSTVKKFIAIGLCCLVPQSYYENEMLDANTTYDKKPRLPPLTYKNADINYQAAVHHLWGAGKQVPVVRKHRDGNYYERITVGDYEEYNQWFYPNEPFAIAQVITMVNAEGKYVLFDLAQSSAPRQIIERVLGDSSVTKLFTDAEDYRVALPTVLLSPFNQFANASFFDLNTQFETPTVRDVPASVPYIDLVADGRRIPFPQYGSALSRGAEVYFHSNGFQQFHNRSILRHHAYYGVPNDRGLTVLEPDGPGYEISKMRALMTMDLTMALVSSDARTLPNLPMSVSARALRHMASQLNTPSTVLEFARNGYCLPPDNWLCKYNVPCMDPFLDDFETHPSDYDNRADAFRTDRAELTRRLATLRTYLRSAEDKLNEWILSQRVPKRKSPNSDDEMDTSSPSSRRRVDTGPQSRPRSRSQTRRRDMSRHYVPLSSQLPALPALDASTVNLQPIPVVIVKQGASQSAQPPIQPGAPQPSQPKVPIFRQQAPQRQDVPQSTIKFTDPMPTDQALLGQWLDAHRRAVPAFLQNYGTLNPFDFIAFLGTDFTKFENLEQLIPPFHTSEIHPNVPIPVIDIPRSRYADYLQISSAEAVFLKNWKIGYRDAYLALCKSRPFAACPALFSALVCEALLCAEYQCTQLNEMQNSQNLNNTKSVASLLFEFALFVSRSNAMPSWSEHCWLRGESQPAQQPPFRPAVLADIVCRGPQFNQLIIERKPDWRSPVTYSTEQMPPASHRLSPFWTLQSFMQNERTVPFASRTSVPYLLKRLYAGVYTRAPFLGIHKQQKLIGYCYKPPAFVRDNFIQQTINDRETIDLIYDTKLSTKAVLPMPSFLVMGSQSPSASSSVASGSTTASETAAASGSSVTAKSTTSTAADASRKSAGCSTSTDHNTSIDSAIASVLQQQQPMEIDSGTSAAALEQHLTALSVSDQPESTVTANTVITNIDIFPAISVVTEIDSKTGIILSETHTLMDSPPQAQVGWRNEKNIVADILNSDQETVKISDDDDEKSISEEQILGQNKNQPLDNDPNQEIDESILDEQDSTAASSSGQSKQQSSTAKKPKRKQNRSSSGHGKKKSSSKTRKGQE